MNITVITITADDLATLFQNEQLDTKVVYEITAGAYSRVYAVATSNSSRLNEYYTLHEATEMLRVMV